MLTSFYATELKGLEKSLTKNTFQTSPSPQCLKFLYSRFLWSWVKIPGYFANWFSGRAHVFQNAPTFPPDKPSKLHFCLPKGVWSQISSSGWKETIWRALEVGGSAQETVRKRQGHWEEAGVRKQMFPMGALLEIFISLWWFEFWQIEAFVVRNLDIQLLGWVFTIFGHEVLSLQLEWQHFVMFSWQLMCVWVCGVIDGMMIEWLGMGHRVLNKDLETEWFYKQNPNNSWKLEVLNYLIRAMAHLCVPFGSQGQ